MTEADNEVCAVCRGKRSEHKDRKHVFTTNPGTLVTPEQAAKGLPQQPSTRESALTGLDAVARMVNLLVDKKLFTPEEGLFVITGRMPGQVSR